MLVKNSVKTIPFFSKWREQTTNILENTRDFAKANSNKYPYGGADQMSFYNIINYQRNRTVFETIVNNEKILLKAVPCEMLNETRSTKITDKTHVIHYKGGWRQILLNGSGFTKNRQKKKSFEMYKVFLQTYLEAIDFLKNFDSDVEVADFGIKIHPYLNTTNWRENKKKYFFFAVKQNILFYIKKIVKLFSLIRKDEN